MRKERLRAIQRAILRHPEHYDQGTFGIPGPGLDDGNFGPLTRRQLYACGSAACVAGFAVALFPTKSKSARSISEKARCALGLTHEQAMRLFSATWMVFSARDPVRRFGERYIYARTPRERAKIAVEWIELMIQQGL